MRFAILAIILLMLLAVACESQPPPGGPGNYCWRVEYDRDRTTRDIKFYTNIDPETLPNGDVLLRDTFYSFGHSGPFDGHDRYDRFAEEIILISAMGRIQRQQFFPCELAND